MNLILKFILISKKNVISIAVVSLFFIIIGILMFITMPEAETVETFSLPSDNKIILIDPGHGGIDAGASADNVREKDINLDIALKLQALIEESGGVAVLTRAEDISTADKNRDKSVTQKKSDLAERKKSIEKYNADIFVSIHMNKFGVEKYSGAQVFYSGTEKSKKLAEIMQKTLKEVLNKDNNRKEKANNKIYVLKDNSVPSVLIECGFLSNENERNNFKNEQYRQKVAWAIYLGINKYFSSEKNCQ